MEDKMAMEALKKYLQMHEDALSAFEKETKTAICEEDARRSAKKVLAMQEGFAVEMGELLVDILAPGEAGNPLMFPLYYMMLKNIASSLLILMADATSDVKKEPADIIMDSFWEGLDEGDH